MSETKVAPPTVRFFDENQNMVHLDVHGSNLDKFGSLPISISEMSRGVEKKPSCRVRLWHWVIMSSLFCLLLWSSECSIISFFSLKKISLVFLYFVFEINKFLFSDLVGSL